MLIVAISYVELKSDDRISTAFDTLDSLGCLSKIIQKCFFSVNGIITGFYVYVLNINFFIEKPIYSCIFLGLIFFYFLGLYFS